MERMAQIRTKVIKILAFGPKSNDVKSASRNVLSSSPIIKSIQRPKQKETTKLKQGHPISRCNKKTQTPQKRKTKNKTKVKNK